MTPSSADHVEARIQGDVSGQVAVGSFIYQIRDVHGGVINIHQPAEPAELRARPRPVTLRPRPFPGLLGRDPEMSQARSAVRDCVPLELHGPAGSGRTSLLRHLAHDLEAENDGLVYLSGRGATLDGVLQVLVGAFYESTDPALRLTPSQLHHRLSDLRASVLVDDVEMDRETLGRLADSAPGCAFVVATPDRRGWGDTRSVAVQGLPLDAAVSLWEREAGPVEPDQRAAVAAVCRAVGGLPLRVVQAAALAVEEQLSPTEVADRFGVETAESEEAAVAAREATGPASPSREARETLDQDAGRVLAVLAAMGAGLAATQVALLADLDTGAAESALDTLLRRRLVVREEDRFVVTEPVPEAAREVESDPGRKRHAVAVVSAWMAGHGHAAARLGGDVPLVERALEWALELEAWTEAERLARSLDGVLSLTGRWDGWKRLQDRIVPLARDRADRALEAWALHQLGTRAACLGDSGAAEYALTLAVEIRDQLGDAPGAALSRHNLDAAGLPVPEPPDTGPGELDSTEAEPKEPGSEAPSGAGAGSGGGTGAGWLGRAPKLAAGVAAVSVAGAVVFSLMGSEDVLTAAPERVEFEAVTLGGAAVQTVTLGNPGSDPLPLDAVRVEPEDAGFRVVRDDCFGVTLEPGAECAVVLEFAPGFTGRSEGRLAVLSPGNSPVTVLLAGTGEATGVAALTADAETVAFGAVQVGEVAQEVVRLRNTGTAPLTLARIEAPADAPFEVEDGGCREAPLEPGETCELGLRFRPRREGEVGARIRIARAGAEPVQLSLRGLGTAAAVGRLTARPSGLEFGTSPVGEAGATHSVELVNDGTGPLRTGGVALEGDAAGDYRVVGESCGRRVLEPGASCEVRLAFTAGAVGGRRAELTVGTDAEGGPVRVAVAGAGSEPSVSRIALEPVVLQFGRAPVHEVPPDIPPERIEPYRAFRIASTGSAPLNIREIEVTGDYAREFVFRGSDCREDRPLQPRESCTVEVGFQPLSVGEHAARLRIDHDGEGASATVRLQGVGVPRTRPEPERPAAPDLVVQLMAGAPKPAANGFHVPVQIAVTNQGGAPAGPFRVSINGGRYLAPFVTPSEGWYIERTTPLAPGQSYSTRGVILLRSDPGQNVEVSALVDSCAGEEFTPAHCRVEEADEANNRSKPVTVRLPVRLPDASAEEQARREDLLRQAEREQHAEAARQAELGRAMRARLEEAKRQELERQRVAVPRQPSAAADLVVRLEALGEPRLAAGGFHVPIRIHVTNRGGAQAAPFKVAIESGGKVVPFHASRTRASWYAERTQPLGGGQSFSMEGLAGLPMGGGTVRIFAIVDSCAGEEFTADYCRVRESSEDNNRSEPISVYLKPPGRSER